MKSKIGLVGSNRLEKTFLPPKEDGKAIKVEVNGSLPVLAAPQNDVPKIPTIGFVRVPSDVFADEASIDEFNQNEHDDSSVFGTDDKQDEFLFADVAKKLNFGISTTNWNTLAEAPIIADDNADEDGYFCPFEFEVEERPLANMSQNILKRQQTPSKYTENDVFGEVSRLLTQFEIGEMIGVGSFGMVFRARHKIDNQFYAIKVIPHSGDATDPSVKEVRNLARASWHPNVIRYFNSWTEALTDDLRTKLFDRLNDSPVSSVGNNLSSSWNDSTCLNGRLETATQVMFVQMELCQRTLRDWLTDPRRKRGGPSRRRSHCLKIFRGIVCGISHTHSMGLMHRDLKPANIFLVEADNPDEPPVAKIGDYGLACDQPVPGTRMTRDLGTPSYSSPEQGTHFYTEAADVYPLGLILFEMLWDFSTAHHRFNVFSELKKGLGHKPFQAEYPRVAKLVDMLLTREAEKRPTADSLISRIDKLLPKILPAHVEEELQRLRMIVSEMRGENLAVV